MPAETPIVEPSVTFRWYSPLMKPSTSAIGDVEMVFLCSTGTFVPLSCAKAGEPRATRRMAKSVFFILSIKRRRWPLRLSGPANHQSKIFNLQWIWGG